MSGNFITIRVSDLVIGGHFDWYTKRERPVTIRPFKEGDNNTYISIFGESQDSQLAQFKEHFKGNILFESVKAVNGKAHHGQFPRNTIVVYEPVSSVIATAPETLHVSSV